MYIWAYSYNLYKLNFLEGLNEQQKGAVECIDGPLMIVAGAGSGKTRVITYRIANLIRKGVNPFQILSLTFTNKAAGEMRHRITDIVGAEARNIWMGTFHSVFAKILRIEADKIGYPSNFTIYDTEDSKSVLKSILKEQNLDDKLYNVNYVYNRISYAKNNLISVKEYNENDKIQADDFSGGRGKMGYIYELYAKRCFKAGAMDFDDLLFKTNILLRDHPEVLYKYQNKFKYILVDEYQDTNFSQYVIVKRLASINENICVVGDDAQSIYAFRGANIQNILNFEKDYPDLKIFKLEENYRSTQIIVNAANGIIKKNKDQLEKNVFSNKTGGEKIKVIKSASDNDEGKQVANSILEEKLQKGLNSKDFAILYRTNAQSRSMEEALRKLGIPYKIYGGLSFYQRKEIKDLIAYFRLSVNHNDEEALKRVINFPIRGIGKTSMDKLIVYGNQNDKNLWECVLLSKGILAGKAGEAVYNFGTMIQSFAALSKTQNAYELANYISSQSGLLKDLFNDKSVEGVSRYENIQELLNGIKEFSEQANIEDKSLGAFLQEITLLTGDENEDPKSIDHVSLMTIHSAKGLEFNQVFVVGLEENLFPSQLSLNSRTDLEEERRLFYVALTRAKNNLTLSYANSRFKWGQLNYCEPSRFLEEIDKQYLEFKFAEPKQSIGGFDRERKNYFDDHSKDDLHFSKISKPSTNKIPIKNTIIHHKTSENFEPDNFNLIGEGMKVEHQRFGFGKVTLVEGLNNDKKATIAFDQIGAKQLLLKFAKLRIIKE